MHWLKDSIVDILVTIFIVIAVFLEAPILSGIIIGYTLVLLIAKGVILIGDDTLNLLNKTKTEAPVWLSHLLYGMNTVVLLYSGWWYTGAGWAVIWALSYMAQRKLDRRKSSFAN